MKCKLTRNPPLKIANQLLYTILVEKVFMDVAQLVPSFFQGRTVRAPSSHQHPIFFQNFVLKRRKKETNNRG